MNITFEIGHRYDLYILDVLLNLKTRFADRLNQTPPQKMNVLSPRKNELLTYFEIF